MDRRQRVFDEEELLRAFDDSRAGGIWTALPGVVDTFDPLTWTVSVLPTIKVRVKQPDGTWASQGLPPLPQCPVCFLGGGGMTSFFTPQHGDEALVIFAARCIDAWWMFGPQQGPDPALDPTEYRMHDLSDGIALVGLRSLPRIIANLPAGMGGLLSNDGTTLIGMNPTAKTVTITAPGGITLNGATISAAGEITDKAGVALGTHEHLPGTYVAPSGGGPVTGESGEPQP